MRAIGRIIILFLGLVFAGGGLLTLAVYANLIPGYDLSALIGWAGWADRNVFLAAGGAMLLIALILIALGLRSAKKTAHAVLKGSEFGEVHISIAAIENMVLRVVQQTQDIKDVGRQVSFTSSGLVVKSRIKVMPDVSLPVPISELQSKIKAYLEETTGIAVREVRVIVENIALDQTVAKKEGG